MKSTPAAGPVIAGAFQHHFELTRQCADLARDNDQLRAQVAQLRSMLDARAPASRRVEWTAAVLGMLGIVTLSTDVFPAWGFGWLLASSIVWIAFALQGRSWGLLTQNVLFFVVSVIGLGNWWFGGWKFAAGIAIAVVVGAVVALAGYSLIKIAADSDELDAELNP